MRLSPTLSGYFAKHFAGWVIGSFLAIMSIVFLMDFMELMRRASGVESAHLTLLLEMALLKLPHMGQEILPFAVLFGSMLAFTRLTRSNELVVARAAGVSVWQFLMPAILVVLLIGAFKVMALNPLSAIMITRFHGLEEQHLEKGADSFLTVGHGGLWVREKSGDGSEHILHATAAHETDAELGGVMIIRFTDGDKFIERIDAARARLENGHWKLREAVVTPASGRSTRVERVAIETRLTLQNIKDSLAAPESMSFWELPGFIQILESAGFSAIRHRLYFHALLASPLLLIAMVLIAATFSMRLTRSGGTLKWAASGLFFGFLLYFVSDLVFALGLSSRIPDILAAWTPATVTMLLGVASLLHLEDG